MYMCECDSIKVMEQKGMTIVHDVYVVVGKQCSTEYAYQHNIFI